MTNNTKSSLAQIRDIRIDKVQGLKDIGIDPYPTKANRTHNADEVISDYSELEGIEVTVTGRLMSWREHGHLIFGHLQDQSGKLQLYIKDDVLEDLNVENQSLGFEELNLIDIGDIVEATGIVTKTERGEISVSPRQFRIITKAIRPLPDKRKGVTDKESRYRRRYLDMTMNPEVRKMFERRAKFWDSVRRFMVDKGFAEVNIPVLEHTTGGADAKPFITHMNALNEDFFLRISHELPLKKLLGAGFEKVFDIGPRFRNEGVDDEHLPEHVAMEWYWAYADMEMGMELTVDLFRFIAKETYGTTKFKTENYEFDLADDWEIMEFSDLLNERFDVDVYNDSEERIIEVFKQNGGAGSVMNKSRAADGLWKIIRKEIHGPAFLVGVPKFLSPLAKSSKGNPDRTDRFHPIIAGSELANAFGELNDPVDQYNRFVDQQKLRESGDDEAQMMDIDFVEMLEYGMPPAVGFGLSERVFWSFEGVSAREGVPFPAMKKSLEATTKEIYDEQYLTELEGNSGEVKKQDLSKKMVVIVQRELEGWQLTNTIGHLTAFLGSQIGKDDLRSRQSFETASGDKLVSNSQYPVITMTAKSSQQLYNLLQKVEESELVHLAYTQEMIDYNKDDELADAYKNLNKDSLNYLGIGIFGPNEEIDKLTKKFGLYK